MLGAPGSDGIDLGAHVPRRCTGQRATAFYPRAPPRYSLAGVSPGEILDLRGRCGMRAGRVSDVRLAAMARTRAGIICAPVRQSRGLRLLHTGPTRSTNMSGCWLAAPGTHRGAVVSHRRGCGRPGSSAARKFRLRGVDSDAGAYRELTSTSNCTNLSGAPAGDPLSGCQRQAAQIAATIGTLATTRWLVAILENHQWPDAAKVLESWTHWFRSWVSSAGAGRLAAIASAAGAGEAGCRHWLSGLAGSVSGRFVGRYNERACVAQLISDATDVTSWRSASNTKRMLRRSWVRHCERHT